MRKFISCVLIAGATLCVPAVDADADALDMFSAVRAARQFERERAPNPDDQKKPVGVDREISTQRTGPTSSPNSTRVYSPDECIGPIIMGECRGAILEHGGYHQTCHGQMLNGQCTGPMF